MNIRVYIWQDCFQVSINNELIGEMEDWNEVLQFVDESVSKIEVIYIPAWYY